MNEQIKIPFRKKKMIPYVVGALVFVLFGVLMIAAAVPGSGSLLTRVVFFLTGLASVLFFGLVAVVMLAKLARTNAGLILDEEGLTDHSSGLPAGFIPWNDIRKISVTTTGNQRFLVIHVKKPEKYLDREPNLLKRTAMRMNYKLSGSPIHIQVSFLDMDLYTLQELIASKRFQQQQAGKEAAM